MSFRILCCAHTCCCRWQLGLKRSACGGVSTRSYVNHINIRTAAGFQIGLRGPFGGNLRARVSSKRPTVSQQHIKVKSVRGSGPVQHVNASLRLRVTEVKNVILLKRQQWQIHFHRPHRHVKIEHIGQEGKVTFVTSCVGCTHRQLLHVFHPCVWHRKNGTRTCRRQAQLTEQVVREYFRESLSAHLT